MMAGDEEAFVCLYRKYQAGVYRFARHMSGSGIIAEDITQEVFMMLMREGKNYDPARGSLPAYLYGIARNYVLRCLERERSFVPIVNDNSEQLIDSSRQLTAQDNPLHNLARNETIENVRRAIVSLPVRYREVVVLCDLDEMSYAEAAVVLNCAVGTVRSRLHRARLLLIEKLRDGGETDGVSSKVKTARCFA